MLVDLLKRSKATCRDLLREKGTAYAELAPANEKLSDDQLIDAMIEHPVLINRPLVVSPLGVRLCRPSDAVLDLFPARQRSAFTKKDGEAVIDAASSPSLLLPEPAKRSGLRWAEIDLDDDVWTMPAGRMKVKPVTVHGFRSSFRDWCAEETLPLGSLQKWPWRT